MVCKQHSGKRTQILHKALVVAIVTTLIITGIYIIFTYSKIPFIRKLRNMAIETSLSTMRHQWVAYAIFPDDVVLDVVRSIQTARDDQIGMTTTWEGVADADGVIPSSRLLFFKVFHELDEQSVTNHLIKNPDLLRNGWGELYINEAGLDDDGTSIVTKQGDTVLAIDAKNGVLLIRVEDMGYRGVLAIAKDPSRVSMCTASTIGYNGQLIGEIAEDNNAILAMNSNGFLDIDIEGNKGKGNGGLVSGIARCNGVTYGYPLGYGFKRAEIRTDNRLYIVDSQVPIHKDCRDATEFTPALIVDGENLVNKEHGWNSINPRSCIGQNDRGDMMMLCIEGRQLSSLGISMVGCAQILERYNCMQAMNLDGGTSSILWFDGECVTRCSNDDYPDGRPIPTAFVYQRAPK